MLFQYIRGSLESVYGQMERTVVFLKSANWDTPQKMRIKNLHLRSLISGYTIRSLESTISILTMCKMLIYYLVLVAQWVVLVLTWSEIPMTGFLASTGRCPLTC